MVPPDPLPNSEVKHSIADGSVGFPHVRVGHCWALIENPDQFSGQGFFMPWRFWKVIAFFLCLEINGAWQSDYV